ncbi:MAG: hypothetical protein LBH36_03320 [Candidatus Nomurabacteria bacterium]|nr:hypothetical protein [Candidatus Nomurabacteria bacterium]
MTKRVFVIVVASLVVLLVITAGRAIVATTEVTPDQGEQLPEGVTIDGTTGVPVADVDAIQAHSLDWMEPTWEWSKLSMPQSNEARVEAASAAAGTEIDDPVSFPLITDAGEQLELERDLYVPLLTTPELLDDHLQGWVAVADDNVDVKGAKLDANTVTMVKAIVAANPWMREALAKVDQSMVKDGPGWSSFMEWRKYDATGDFVTTPTREDALVLDGKVVFVNTEYRKYATAYIYVLDCFDIAETSAKEAVNWNMLPQGSIQYHRSGVNDKTESLTAIWFKVVHKDGRSGLFGVNLFDKRIEFPVKSTRPAETTTTTPGGGEGGGGGLLKDPTKSSNNSPNTGRGGGTTDGSAPNGGKDQKYTEPSPPAVYAPPSAPPAADPPHVVDQPGQGSTMPDNPAPRDEGATNSSGSANTGVLPEPD